MYRIPVRESMSVTGDGSQHIATPSGVERVVKKLSSSIKVQPLAGKVSLLKFDSGYSRTNRDKPENLVLSKKINPCPCFLIYLN